MKLTVADIANLVNGQVSGEGSRVITSAAGLSEAKPSDVSFLKSSSDANSLKFFSSTQAGAVITSKGLKSNGGKTTIEVENPMAAFAQVLAKISEEKRPVMPGIHSLAYVSPKAKIGKGVFIGPFCIIEDDAELGDGARLLGQDYVGTRSKIGKDTLIYPQVVLREEVTVGDRCIIHAGAILGSDGYGFFFSGGKHNKIPQVGTVVIEDDVEIGSCTTVDRATTGATLIRRGTKIDNQVQVAHNVDIGEHSLLVAQVGIGGSTKLGKGVVMAGQTGAADHVTIGEGAQIGAGGGVTKDIAPGSVVWGLPAEPVRDVMKQKVLVRRLPELFKDVKDLKEKLKKKT